MREAVKADWREGTPPFYRNLAETVNRLELPPLSHGFSWCQENLSEVIHADSRGMKQQTEMAIRALN